MKDAKGYEKSLSYLTKNIEYRDTHYTYYFEYYMSQALFQAPLKIIRKTMKFRTIQEQFREMLLVDPARNSLGWGHP